MLVILLNEIHLFEKEKRNENESVGKLHGKALIRVVAFVLKH